MRKILRAFLRPLGLQPIGWSRKELVQMMDEWNDRSDAPGCFEHHGVPTIILEAKDASRDLWNHIVLPKDGHFPYGLTCYKDKFVIWACADPDHKEVVCFDPKHLSSSML